MQAAPHRRIVTGELYDGKNWIPSENDDTERRAARGHRSTDDFDARADGETVAVTA
jgi:hypothetical protein